MLNSWTMNWYNPGKWFHTLTWRSRMMMDYGSLTASMNWYNYLMKQIADGLRSTWWGRSCNNDVWKQKAIMQYSCLKFSGTWYLRIPGVSTMQRCSCRCSRFFYEELNLSSLPRRCTTKHLTRTFLIWINLSCIFELSSAHPLEHVARARAIFLCLIVVLREWFYLFLKRSALSARYFCALLLCL